MVREWARQNGVHADRMALTLTGQPVLVLPLHAGGHANNGAEAGEKGRGLSQIPLDILAILESAARPLTTTQLLAEMSKRRMEWSQRAVSEHLARMVEDGTLENPEGARPRGYRLPE
jgi:hypothetical protein